MNDETGTGDLDLLGERFPPQLEERFELESLLGSGGTSVVYLARDRTSDTRVAVKVLRAHASKALAARISREAKILRGLDHPAVLRLLEAGEVGGEPYLVTDHVEGTTLLEVRDEARLLDLMLQVADGLQVVHEAGLVHRDVKPSNILVTRDDRVVLIDFGIAHDPDRTRLTRTGQVVGTMGYIAPEVLAGREATAASDWFSWGATYFGQLEGHLPGQTDPGMDPAGQPMPARPRRVHPRSPLGQLLRRCLSPYPDERPADAGEIRAVLEGAGDPVTLVTAGELEEPPGPAAARGGGGRLAAGVAGVCLALGLGIGHFSGAGLPVYTGGEQAAWLSDGGLRIEEEDRDPLRWARLVQRSPAVRELFDRLRAGGDPATLPPRTLEELREVDRVLEAAELPRVARPFLQVRPLPAGPFPAELRRHLEKGTQGALPGADPVQGWLAAAVTIHQRLPRKKGKKHQPVDEPPSGEESRSVRIEMARRYRTQVEDAISLIHAVSRAVREQPGEAERATLLFGSFSHNWNRLLAYAPVQLDPDVLLGPSPDTLAGSHLRGTLLDHLHRRRRDLDLEGFELPRYLSMERSAQLAPGPDPMSRALHMEAVEWMLDRHRKQENREKFRALLLGNLDELRYGHPWTRWQVMFSVCWFSMHQKVDLALSPAQAEAVVSELRHTMELYADDVMVRALPHLEALVAGEPG